MRSWQTHWQPAAERDLKRCDRQTQERILAAVARLIETDQGDVVLLKNVKPPEWRLRVGQWRVRFRRNEKNRTVEVLRILPRDKAY